MTRSDSFEILGDATVVLHDEELRDIEIDYQKTVGAGLTNAICSNSSCGSDSRNIAGCQNVSCDGTTDSGCVNIGGCVSHLQE